MTGWSNGPLRRGIHDGRGGAGEPGRGGSDGFDAGRTGQNMMLAAWAEGITSCPVAMHDRECAARVLGVPDDHQVAMVLTFGYPESKEAMPRGVARTPLAALVRYERWSF